MVSVRQFLCNKFNTLYFFYLLYSVQLPINHSQQTMPFNINNGWQQILITCKLIIIIIWLNLTVDWSIFYTIRCSCEPFVITHNHLRYCSRYTCTFCAPIYYLNIFDNQKSLFAQLLRHHLLRHNTHTIRLLSYATVCVRARYIPSSIPKLFQYDWL